MAKVYYDTPKFITYIHYYSNASYMHLNTLKIKLGVCDLILSMSIKLPKEPLPLFRTFTFLKNSNFLERNSKLRKLSF